MKRLGRGFTLVELLIVIVIISILAAITIVAYNGIQNKARASAIASDLRAVDKAFNLYKIDTGATAWWPDSDPALTGGSNPLIANIITAQPGFQAYLQKAPTTDGLDTANKWFYDNDSDTYNGCSASTSGVNIAILAPTSNVAQGVDDAIDDGNLACGRFRSQSGYLVYALANSSS